MTSTPRQSSFDCSCEPSSVVRVRECVRGSCAVPETSNVVSPFDTFLYYGGSLTNSCKAGYWFIQMFVLSIDKAKRKETKEERFAELFRTFLSLLFIMISRSLFEAYKPLYSVMLCLKCQDTERDLKLSEITAWTTGLLGFAKDEKPEKTEWLSQVS